MTPRERLLTCINGRIPDCVPVSPDFSNMIPARLTGKPFWDLYLYNDPPIWDAYIDCAKHFNIDAVMDGYFPFHFPSDPVDHRPWENFTISQADDRIITQRSYKDGAKRVWDEWVVVYYKADSPTQGRHQRLGLEATPAKYVPVEGVKSVDLGVTGLRALKARMGQQGLVGIFVTSSSILHCEDDIYRFYDSPDSYRLLRNQRMETVERRFDDLRAMAPEDRPDFICVGGSGSLIFQTMEILREYALPAVKRAIELATDMGLPTHVHCCGPEAKLVELMATETTLTVIDPLEIPPMGDCDLADLKRRFGNRIVLKGNLHTTNLMWRGTAEQVAAASRKAIDDAAAGGRFILSTGDQCGRDTPDENLHAMINTARTYGQYRNDGTVKGASSL